jgi:hypothetical protein
VDSLDVDQINRPAQTMRATAFITFSQDPKAGPEFAWATSYCEFQPGARRGNVKQAVSWLHEYVKTYGDERSPIVADFDAYHAYFDRVDFPLVERVKGRVSSGMVQSYANSTQETILVFGDYMHGDQFKNVQGSTITNRSALAVRPENDSEVRK